MVRTMTSLLSLPPELIALIFQFLDNAEILATRVASKYLESSSLSYFGKHFFRKKGFLITTPSINVLKAIAAHEQIRKYVQHVWFNPDCYTYITPECSPEYGDDISRGDIRSEEVERRWRTYQAVQVDHRSLLYTAALEQELTKALRMLPNLEIIGMRRSEEHSPWGWRMLEEAIGEDPRKLGPIPSGPTKSLSGPTHLFLAITNALAKTNVKLNRFYTDAIEIDNIRRELLPQEKLGAAFQSLLYLEVNASRAWVEQKPSADYSTLSDEAEIGEGMLQLMQAMPNLLELGLQAFPDLKPRYVGNVRNGRHPESWQSSYPYLVFQKLVRNVELSHLTRLKLEKITTTQAMLQSFLTPCQSCLSSLKIRDIRLLWTKEEKRPWRPIFKFLRDRCTELIYILFYHLKYNDGGVAFVDRQLASAVYTGPAAGAIPAAPDAARGGAVFAEYSDIALEVVGQEEAKAKLDEIVDKHWYRSRLYSYPMDEEMWHTDTSDEEW